MQQHADESALSRHSIQRCVHRLARHPNDIQIRLAQEIPLVAKMSGEVLRTMDADVPNSDDGLYRSVGRDVDRVG
jgi:hypothetical protein